MFAGDGLKRILILLLLASLAFASNNSTSTDTPPPPAPIIDFGPILGALAALPGQIVSSFFTYVVDGLSSTIASLRDATFKFMFSSPDPGWFCAQYNGVIAVLDSLYALVLMGLALFFILRSGDVEGRLTARKWMENLLIMIVLLSVSFQFFRVLTDFNTSLTNSLASSSMASMFGTQANPSSLVFAFVVLAVGVVLGVLTYLTLLLRYLLMPFMLLLFPVSIFLYFIPITQKWGKTFLQLILVFVFMTTADALVLLGLSAMFGSSDPNLGDALVRSFATIFGFAALGVVNIALIIIALLSVLTQSRAVTGVAGFTLLKTAVAAV